MLIDLDLIDFWFPCSISISQPPKYQIWGYMYQRTWKLWVWNHLSSTIEPDLKQETSLSNLSVHRLSLVAMLKWRDSNKKRTFSALLRLKFIKLKVYFGTVFGGRGCIKYFLSSHLDSRIFTGYPCSGMIFKIEGSSCFLTGLKR